MTNSSLLSDFKRYVEEGRDLLNLRDYDVTVDMQTLGNNYKSNIQIDYINRVANIHIDKEWYPKNKKEVRRTALHECLHIMLAELRYLATERYITPGHLYAAEERICMLLEFIL